MAGQAWCSSAVPAEPEGKHVPTPVSGPMKEPLAKSSMVTEPQLVLSAHTSPCFPSVDWMVRPKLLLYPRPGSFRTSQAFRTLANRILRIHLNSKSKIWNNEKADTVAQHGFGLTAA